MSKIKVVQIAIAASTDDTWTQQYLDDKGRVWEYLEIMKRWVQLDLPDEPKPTQEPK